jgi:tRNA A-37 threonylcarbamoyl transferase component Bud32
MTVKELSAYAKTQSAGIREDVLISGLLGIVKDPRTSRIVEPLLTYIDSNNRTLLCAKRDASMELRQKWIDQINRSIRELHAHRIAWGDAKPNNVLVDVHNNAYLIDFGGGYTAGWIDKDQSNSMERDLQGLKRIVKYLSEEVS